MKESLGPLLEIYSENPRSYMYMCSFVAILFLSGFIQKCCFPKLVMVPSAFTESLLIKEILNTKFAKIHFQQT